MGTTLNGTTPQNTYPSLIKVGDNGALSATAKVLSDGEGNDSILALSTTAVGIGTNAPTKELTIDANSTDGGLIIRSQNDSTLFQVTKDGTSANTCELFQFSGGAINFAIRSASNASYFNNGTFTFGATTNLGAKVNIKGTGSTSATTSLLVQNSAGIAALTVKDDLGITMKGITNIQNYQFVSGDVIASASMRLTTTSGGVAINTSYASANASAQLDVASTTKGFLPPRMTTTQKNAIASPAAGLVVYDTTLNKLCVYTTAWETITSL